MTTTTCAGPVLDIFPAIEHIGVSHISSVTGVCKKTRVFSSSNVLKWRVFLQTQHNIIFFLNKLPAGDPELIWSHPHKQSMSGTATVPLHKRTKQPNLSAVPNFCNAATHSTRLRDRDHERGSLSGRERPCSAALRMRTTTAHYLAGWRHL